MSSAKPIANRRVIVRLWLVIVTLAVLAAGCSQSENGVSDGSEPATSTSQAGLSSAAPPAAESTTTTQAAVEEQPPSSGSEIATTTTSLVPAVLEGSLSDEAIRLIDVAVDTCTDLLEFKCAGAVRDICLQLRSGDDVILTEDEQIGICTLDSIVHLWEVDAVLSAKYGEEYYRWNPGFLAFRDEFHSGARSFLASNPDLFSQTGSYYNWKIYSYKNVEDIGSFDEFVDSSTWGEYLPDAVRLKLLRIFYDLGLASQFELDNLSVKSEDVANRILGVPDFPEAHRKCFNEMSLADMLTSEPTRRSTLDLEVFICIETLCANRKAGDAVVCYFEDSDIDEFSNGRTILRGRSATISGFLWNSIKYFCARDEANDTAFPNDACHNVAAKICQIVSRLALSKEGGTTEYLNLHISSRVERSACGLGSAWHYQIFNNARAGCYREIENLLTTMDLLSAQDSNCNDASEEYVEFWQGREFQGREYVRIYYPVYWYELFRQYYAFEVFWQKIPLICSKNNNASSIFANSECYNSIRRFCDSRYGTVDKNGIYAGDHLGRHYENLMRGGKKIREALCGKILDARTQVSLENNSRHAYLNLKSHKSRKQLISLPNYYPLAITRKKELAVQFTENNIANITSAAERCTDNSFALSETECVTELWKSCFDLLSYRTSSQKQYFYEYYHVSGSQEFWNSITYVCNAAWIAELARMASALLSSFPEDYQAGSFNQFLQYIANEAVDGGEGILAIDEGGTARPNLNRDGLSTEVAETLTALGTSIAQFVQPYLSATNSQTQQSTA